MDLFQVIVGAVSSANGLIFLSTRLDLLNGLLKISRPDRRRNAKGLKTMRRGCAMKEDVNLGIQGQWAFIGRPGKDGFCPY